MSFATPQPEKGFGMDFGALPPEINSGRMYCGPGSGPMLAAAAAWDGVAVELGLAATGYASVIAELTGAPWVGAASLSMVAAATPYVAWLSQAAARAEQAGMQAAAAAAAYEAAFVMTVPPPVITANRVLVMTLIATNFFGQNSAAIAVAEAQYAEMWAQDAVAMYGYAAASASASRLIPFAAPPKTTNSAGVVAQVAAVAAMPGLLQRLSSAASVSWSNPNDWWLVRLLGSITPTERTTIVRLLGQSYFATGMAQFFASIAQQLTFGPGGTTAGSGGAWYPTPQFAGLGAGPAVSASLARAEPVGRLSVPPSWAVAAPAFAEKPEAGTPMSVIGEASSCGQGGLLRGIPLARAGRRTGAFAHRYGFRHSVITRSPSAG
ncbi:PPE family protein [Mycobacterium tuberculosis]|nr:PPE family protein [Mycobacterium tuberculosis]CLA73133.1 PPE family protein [Mycobacterium tuberculosis]CMS89096.1 PPE family protein [Mycobacterium tuberculosis]